MVGLEHIFKREGGIEREGGSEREGGR